MSLRVTLYAPAKKCSTIAVPRLPSTNMSVLGTFRYLLPSACDQTNVSTSLLDPNCAHARKLLSHALLGMWYGHDSGAFAMRIVLGSPIYASISRIPTQGKSKNGKPPTCAVRLEFTTRQEQDWKTSDLRGAVQISCWQVLATQVQHFQG